MDTKEVIEKLKTLGATIKESETSDGGIRYSIDISTIPNENARLTVAQLLESITKEDGIQDTSK
jgi:hypothetical protein